MSASPRKHFLRNGFVLLLVVIILNVALFQCQARPGYHIKRAEIFEHGSGFGDETDAINLNSDTEAVQNDHGRRQLDNVASTQLGLPQSCLTYEERYGPYRIAGDRGHGKTLGDGNHENLASKYVVILQLHHEPDGLKEDLLLSMRALSREVQAVGFQFFILYQIPTSKDGFEIEGNWTYEQVLSLLPHDFRDVMVVHDAKEDYEVYYPKIQQNIRLDIREAPGPVAPHAGLSIFMHRYRSYEFAFVVEFDVRLTGHWGRYFASALQIAIEAKGTEKEGIEGVELEHEVNTASLPPPGVHGLPDLIAFEAIWESDKWSHTQTGYNITTVEEMKAMVYGGSRKLFDKMHEEASEGRDIYLESFLPYLPKLIPDGKRIVLKIPTEGESFHCCSPDGPELYRKFVNSTSGQCSPNYLIHPIKTTEPWWALESSRPNYSDSHHHA